MSQKKKINVSLLSSTCLKSLHAKCQVIDPLQPSVQIVQHTRASDGGVHGPIIQKETIQEREGENSILKVENNGERKLSGILYKGPFYASNGLAGFLGFFSSLVRVRGIILLQLLI